MTEVVSVYRVESICDGLGPYTDSDFGNRLSVTHSNDDHPTPICDGCGYVESRWVCACTSLESLIEWFRGFLFELKLEGFVVVHYVVPKSNVRFGEHQVIFTRGECDRETIPWGEVFTNVTPMAL